MTQNQRHFIYKYGTVTVNIMLNVPFEQCNQELAYMLITKYNLPIYTINSKY